MNRWTKEILLAVVILFTAGAGMSEEHEEEQTTIDSETASQQEEVTNQTEVPGGENTEAFVPSEEISEDLSVPFPVDI